jgi:hypothetical protein
MIKLSESVKQEKQARIDLGLDEITPIKNGLSSQELNEKNVSSSQENSTQQVPAPSVTITPNNKQ